MTISIAIGLLQGMKEKHGDIEVLFDCGYCGKSTIPAIVVAMVVVQDISKYKEK